MSKFFIHRPIFAWVVAIMIMLLGVLAIKGLPISQYPDVAPPAIAISVTYPGASAQTVQDTVVQVIEQQLNGLDGLRYISSVSSGDGNMTIIVTFEQGTNPDIAQVQVQNKLSLATPLLPQEVQLVERFKPLQAKADTAAEVLAGHFRSGDVGALTGFAARDMYAAIDPLQDVLGQLMQVQLDEAKAEYDRAASSYQTIRALTLGAVVLGICWRCSLAAR